MKHQETIELDLTLIVGVGGESIVLKTTENINGEDRECVVKSAACDISVGEKVSFFDIWGKELISTGTHLPELISTDFEHNNIIKYWKTLLQTIDSDLFHFSGK